MYDMAVVTTLGFMIISYSSIERKEIVGFL
jgi:hypothetical protein